MGPDLSRNISHQEACQLRAMRLINRLASQEACAPVAQLDRASDYESEGQRFESFRARHLNQRLIENLALNSKFGLPSVYRLGALLWCCSLGATGRCFRVSDLKLNFPDGGAFFHFPFRLPSLAWRSIVVVQNEPGQPTSIPGRPSGGRKLFSNYSNSIFQVAIANPPRVSVGIWRHIRFGTSRRIKKIIVILRIVRAFFKDHDPRPLKTEREIINLIGDGVDQL